MWVCCIIVLPSMFNLLQLFIFISISFLLLVCRERADRPFRCLDCQYRRELVRVYLTNVEQICRRFVEERRSKLGKLIDDKARWSRYCAFTFIKYSLELWLSVITQQVSFGGYIYIYTHTHTHMHTHIFFL